jgi:hypothetical protein
MHITGFDMGAKVVKVVGGGYDFWLMEVIFSMVPLFFMNCTASCGKGGAIERVLLVIRISNKGKCFFVTS